MEQQISNLLEKFHKCNVSILYSRGDIEDGFQPAQFIICLKWTVPMDELWHLFCAWVYTEMDLESVILKENKCEEWRQRVLHC